MIKRYFATKDNTITNAFQEDLVTRGTGSNMGQADILEVFSIYGQASSSAGLTSEKSRIIIQFDTATAAADRTAGRIPSSGGVSWYLKLYNAKHSQTLPRDYTLEVLAVSASWEEGLGLDMEGYTDLTYGVKGSNWLTSSTTVSWKNLTQTQPMINKAVLFMRALHIILHLTLEQKIWKLMLPH